MVVASLCLSSCLGKVAAGLQAGADDGTCHGWQDPILQEPGGGNPYRAAICTCEGRRILFVVLFLQYRGH